MKGDSDRVDTDAKATYAAEVAHRTVTYAVIVGSTVARGRITSLDDEAARNLPGVLRVITFANTPWLADQQLGVRASELLHDDNVWYVDQPIAVVVADSLECARRAAAAIRVTYEPTASVVPQATMPAAASADPDATTAVWHGTERITIYDSTQGIFDVRNVLAARFGLERRNVRVLNDRLAGKFGCKGSPWTHVVLTALVALAVGRPVTLVLSRAQRLALASDTLSARSPRE